MKRGETDMYDLQHETNDLEVRESLLSTTSDTSQVQVKKVNQNKEIGRGIGSISHSFEEESQEAKARWFQTLTIEERMEMLCMFTDMILGVNPHMMERKDVKPVAGRVLVLTQS